MLLPAILIVWVGHWMGLGLAVSLMFLPIAGYAPSLLRKQELPPMYARAIARIKFGKYSEAEWEIIQELEKHQNDFDGWLMLAELYATRFGDVNEAEQTILEICDQPKVTPSQMSVALHKLADWHLNLRNDPEAARRALQVICLRLPGSHLARMAKVRADSLPISSEDLKEQKEHRPVHLPALSDSLIEGEEAHEPERPVEELAAEANRLSERLRQNPNDTALRERLARILAGNLDQADVAIDELELLLQMPDQPPAKRAEWLGLMAIWELHHRKNRDASRLILERIVKEFPSSPHAMAASRRLRQMTAEDVMKNQPPPPKIGKIEI